MTPEQLQDFVTRFAAAWAARDGKAFLDLWHPDGTLYTPLVNRPIKGSELPKLMELQIASAPDFVWQLLDWTSRGDVVIGDKVGAPSSTSFRARANWRAPE
jgi:hypothetical protein